jgi:hypothetical protein
VVEYTCKQNYIMTIKDLKEALDLFAADSEAGENTPVSITIDQDGEDESAPITSVGFWSEKEVEIVVRP